jgi:hypothetical protein
MAYRILSIVSLALLLQSCAYYTAPVTPAPVYYGGYASPSVSVFTPIVPIFVPRYYYSRSGYYYGWGGWGRRHHYR